MKTTYLCLFIHENSKWTAARWTYTVKNVCVCVRVCFHKQYNSICIKLIKSDQIFSYQDIASGITVLWHELWVIDTGCKKNFQETILV